MFFTGFLEASTCRPIYIMSCVTVSLFDPPFLPPFFTSFVHMLINIDAQRFVCIQYFIDTHQKACFPSFKFFLSFLHSLCCLSFLVLFLLLSFLFYLVFFSPSFYFFLSFSPFCLSLYITYKVEVTCLMRPVRCAAIWYCAYNIIFFHFWRYQKGRQRCTHV